MKKQERETDIFSDKEFDRVEKLYQAITNIDSDMIERAQNIPHHMKLHKKIFARLCETMKQAKEALSEAIEDVEIEGRTVVTALVCVCVIFIAGAFISSYFGGTSGSSLNEGEETTEVDGESEEITDASDESEEITEETLTSPAS